MKTELFVSLFLAVLITYGVMGVPFSTWQTGLGFLLAWASTFFLGFGIHEYAIQRHQRLTGEYDGRDAELRSRDLVGPFVGSAFFAAGFAVVVAFTP